MPNRLALYFCSFLLLICTTLTSWANTSLLYGSSQTSGSSDFLPVEEAFVFSGRVDQERAHIDVQVMPGHYLYKHRFSFSPQESDTTLGEPEYPAGVEIFDPYYQKNLETFDEHFTIELPITHRSQLPELEISFQGCAKAGLCYPPHKIIIPLVVASDSLTPLESLVTMSSAKSPVSEESFYKNQLEQKFLMALLLFFIAGIGLSFTPCVLPMFPILSSLILGNRESSRSRMLTLSITYVLSMSLTFALAGTLMGMFGASLNLQAKLQSPWLIYPMAGLFVILAMSMLGLYELQLPETLRNKLSNNNPQGGNLTGVITMGILSALVVSPCVSAPLAGALVYISTTGNAFYGGLTLFSLGLGMGIPLLIFALGGRHLLPKAGNWMNNVRAVFGVMLLGVSIWMLDRVMPAQLILALWGILLIGCAVFLGIFNFSEKGNIEKTAQALGIILLIYGICLLVGAAMGNRNPLKPLDLQGAGVATSSRILKAPEFTKTASVAELDQLLAEAAKAKKPVMVDLYADWCISCKVIERNVFPDPMVADKLSRLTLIKLDITENTKAHQQLLDQYQLFGPPALLFFNPEGQEVEGIRSQGDISVTGLNNRLERFLTIF